MYQLHWPATCAPSKPALTVTPEGARHVSVTLQDVLWCVSFLVGFFCCCCFVLVALVLFFWGGGGVYFILVAFGCFYNLAFR